jgi:hypothetical protein
MMKKLNKKSAAKTVAAYKGCKCEIRCFIQNGMSSASKVAMNSAMSAMNRNK